MCLCFNLKVPCLPVLTVVVSKGSFDIDWVRVMPLDEVRVVTIHRTHEGGKGGK